MIEIEDLTLQRGGEAVVHDVSARLPAGGITALIGPNGAGKSTLLHALAGLVPVASGRVRIGEEDLAALAPPERALRIALMTQAPPAVSRLTVAELVGFGRWPHHRGRERAEDRAAVAAALADFDLGALAGRAVCDLSGGQRQRALVAMAHAQDTPSILLDEPLAALDPRYTRDIMDRLHALTRPRTGARSAVVVLHDLGMAASFADRVVALKDGRLAFEGPAAEVLTSERLSALYDTPLQVAEFGGRRTVLHAAAG